MGDTMLKIDDLTVAYGGIKAVKGISLEVDRGELVALMCFERAPGDCHRHCVAEALGVGAQHL